MPETTDTNRVPAPEPPESNPRPAPSASATDPAPFATTPRQQPSHQAAPATTDEHWMRQALSLAETAVGLASPNPTVGCVLVRNGTVVGRGAHLYDQLDHAEVVALRQAGNLAHAATAYVTLEPCSHTGRTGPCAEALIRAQVARVVIATADPNPLVSGRGIARLRQAGIAVDLVEGSLPGPGARSLSAHARQLNDGFARFIRHQLPFVTLKAGLSLDGRIAPAPLPPAPDPLPSALRNDPPHSFLNSLKDTPPHPLSGAFPDPLPKSLAGSFSGLLPGSVPGSVPESVPEPREFPAPGATYLTSPHSLVAVQRMRHASDAILTGIGTVLHDNPLLTDRSGLPRRRPLLRVILDSDLRLSPTSRLVATARQNSQEGWKADLLLYTANASTKKADQLRQAGVQIEQVDLVEQSDSAPLPPGNHPLNPPSATTPLAPSSRRLDLRAILRSLAQRNILNLLVEGGSHLNRALLDQDLADKLKLFYAPLFLGDQGVPLLAGPASLHPKLQSPTLTHSGDDFCLEAYLHDPWR